MDGLDDFMLFNACEDAKEEQERSATSEYPYQKLFWEDNDKKSSIYWDSDDSSSEDE